MSYADVLVMPVQKRNLEHYRELSRKSEALWREYGAIDYHEWIADDVKPGKVTSFPQSLQLKDDEVVGVGVIIFKSRAHRDEVNAKVMADPRMKIDLDKAPFDAQRMFFGGFNPLY